MPSTGLLQSSSDPHYENLVTAMSQRLLLQSAQSRLFHSQQQKVNEKVDDYAQNLSRLYQKDYPQVNQGSQDTMGKVVLAYQFVPGRLPEIPVKWQERLINRGSRPISKRPD